RGARHQVTRLSNTQHPVGVFVVEKIALVERADLVEHLTTHRERRPRQSFRLPRAVRTARRSQEEALGWHTQPPGDLPGQGDFAARTMWLWYAVARHDEAADRADTGR